MPFLLKNNTFLLKTMPYIILGLVFISHFTFIEADADLNLTNSRGPWTDEGLYASQIRNYILHNQLNLDKSDTAIKTPLFAGILFTSFNIFGISHIIARITVLLLSFCLIIFATINSSFYKNLLIPLSLLTLFQYHVFHYSHYSLAEIVGTAFIFCWN